MVATLSRLVATAARFPSESLLPTLSCIHFWSGHGFVRLPHAASSADAAVGINAIAPAKRIAPLKSPQPVRFIITIDVRALPHIHQHFFRRARLLLTEIEPCRMQGT